jgi:hypothetical protein
MLGRRSCPVVLVVWPSGPPVWYIWYNRLKCALTSATTAGVTVATDAAAATGTDGLGGLPGALRVKP